MGARLLRSWILRPLIDRSAIDQRLDAVGHLVQQTVVRGEIRKELRGIQDLERLTSRITLGQAGPRELVALRKSLSQLPVLRNFVTPPPAGGSALLRHLYGEIDELNDVRETLLLAAKAIRTLKSAAALSALLPAGCFKFCAGYF